MLHDLIRDAIIAKRSVTARAPQGIRRFSPHALGKEADGTEVIVGFQYAGADENGPDAAPHWCCLRLDGLKEARLNDDPWATGPGTPPRDHLVSIEVWNF